MYVISAAITVATVALFLFSTTAANPLPAPHNCTPPSTNVYFPPAPCNETDPAVRACGVELTSCLAAISTMDSTSCESAVTGCQVKEMQCMELVSLQNQRTAASCEVWYGSLNSSLLNVAMGGSYQESYLYQSCHWATCELATLYCGNTSGTADLVPNVCTDIATEAFPWSSEPPATPPPPPTPPPTPTISMTLPTPEPIIMPSNFVTRDPIVTYTPPPPITDPPPTTAEPTTAVPETTLAPTEAPTPIPTIAPTPQPCPVTTPFECEAAHCTTTNISDGCQCSDSSVNPYVWIHQGVEMEANAASELRLESTAFYAPCEGQAPGDWATDLKYVWSMTDLDTGRAVSIKGFGHLTRTLQIDAKSLGVGSKYQLLVTVTTAQYAKTGTANITINAVAPIPKTTILGGSRTMSWTSPLQIVLLVDDPFLTTNVVRWSCCKASESICVGLCHPPLDNLLLFKTFTLDLTPSSGKPFPTGSFQFHARYKEQQVSVDIEILRTEKAVPEILLFEPDGLYIYDQRRKFSGTAKMPPDSTATIVKWRWLTNGTQEKITQEPKITFPKSRFPPFTPVSLELEATTSEGIVSSGTIVFSTTTPIETGFCEVSSAELQPVATVSEMSIASKGARGPTTHSKLLYRFGFIDDTVQSSHDTASGQTRRLLSFLFTDSPNLRVTAPTVTSFLISGARKHTVNFFVDITTADDSSSSFVTSMCSSDVYTFLLKKSKAEVLHQTELDMKSAAEAGQRSVTINEAQLVISAAQDASSSTRMGLLKSALSNVTLANRDADDITATERVGTLGILKSALELAPSASTVPADVRNDMAKIAAQLVTQASNPNDNLDAKSGATTILEALNVAGDAADPTAIRTIMKNLGVAVALEAPIGGQSAEHVDGYTVTAGRRFGFDLNGAKITPDDDNSLLDASGFEVVQVPPSAVGPTSMVRVVISTYDSLQRPAGSDETPTRNDNRFPMSRVATISMFKDENNGASTDVGSNFDRSAYTNKTLGVVHLDIKAYKQKLQSLIQKMKAAKSDNASSSHDHFRSLEISEEHFPAGIERLNSTDDVTYECHGKASDSGPWHTLDSTPTFSNPEVASCPVSRVGSYTVMASIPIVTSVPETPEPTVDNFTYAPVKKLESSGDNAVHALTISLSSLAGILILVLAAGVIGIWAKPLEKLKIKMEEKQEEKEARFKNVQASAAQRGIFIEELNEDPPKPFHDGGHHTSSSPAGLGDGISALSPIPADRELQYLGDESIVGPTRSDGTKLPMKLVIDDEIQLLVVPNANGGGGTHGSLSPRRRELSPEEDPAPWL